MRGAGRTTGRNDRGVVLPAAALVVSLVAVAAAAVGYVLSASPHQPSPVTAPTPHRAPVTPVKKAKPPKPLEPRRPARDEVKRADTYVVVFNNSNVSGLAGRTAAKAQAVGWNVVATDNWYGTIDAPTVYYPQRLHAAAKLLARDLGITRIKPAIDPMQMDRLTVILTAGYSG